MTKQSQAIAFIRASILDGSSNESLEDALVCMFIVKTHAQAKRLITMAQK
jgi:hypothetical protein